MNFILKLWMVFLVLYLYFTIYLSIIGENRISFLIRGFLILRIPFGAISGRISVFSFSFSYVLYMFYSPFSFFKMFPAPRSKFHFSQYLVLLDIVTPVNYILNSFIKSFFNSSLNSDLDLGKA